MSDNPISDKQERQSAYRLAVKKNSIKPSMLMKLHKKNKNIIDKWLYVKDSHPDFQACYELERFVRALRGEMPIELTRIIYRSKTRVNELIKTIEVNPLSEFKITGNRNRNGHKASTIFLYEGQKVSVGELATKFGINRTTLAARIKAAGLYLDNTDLADFMHKPVKRGRKNKGDK